MLPKIIVTGAAGFIGSALCRYLRGNNLAEVIGVDKMTYASSRAAVGELAHDKLFTLMEAEICDGAKIVEIIGKNQPDGIMHLAAETHVDRSIDRPGDFLQANVVGTYSLLEMVRHYLTTLPEDKRAAFRFLHVSTDEVYGSVASGRSDEGSAYAPNSPYAASKASSDHIARAWCQTFGMPVIITNTANNYGPFQFPEKLIPLMITKAIKGERMPVYGKGENVRDWLYVDDHAEALWLVFNKGRVGEKYHIGSTAEQRNIDLVKQLCAILDEMLPQSSHRPHNKLIEFVADRPGHDLRYAMDFSKIEREFGWRPRTSFEDGLRKTVNWYLSNKAWCDEIHARVYAGQRLGSRA